MPFFTWNLSNSKILVSLKYVKSPGISRVTLLRTRNWTFKTSNDPKPPPISSLMPLQARNFGNPKVLEAPKNAELTRTSRLMPFHVRDLSRKLGKPKASDVLTCYLQQCGEPPWTSYFVKYKSVKDDQWGKSHFNWKVGDSNYHILRTGCYPYIKYHCTKRPFQNLTLEDFFFRCIKVLNLGIPCLAYGIAALFLIRHIETVTTPCGPVQIFFLYPEDKGSQY